MRNRSKNLATGGVFAALSLTVLFLSGVLPFSGYLCPAAAGLLLLPVCDDLGFRPALLTFLAVGALGLFLRTDLEASAIYLAFFGYYPLLRIGPLSRMTRRRAFLCGFAIFTAGVALCYGALYLLLGPAFFAEFQAGGPWMLILFAGAAALVFVLYDRALPRLYLYYRCNLRPRWRR